MDSETKNKIMRSKEKQDEADEKFDALQDELLTRDLSNTEHYDKAILTLSSASLGISLTIIRFLVPLESARWMWLLKLGWTLLLVCIASSLAAFLVSNKAIKIQLANAREYYKKGIASAFNRPNIFAKANTILNSITGLLLLFALAAILIFVTLNLEKETKVMSKEIENTDSPQGTFFKKSANIPEMEEVSGTQSPSQDTSEGNGGGDDSGSNSESDSGDSN